MLDKGSQFGILILIFFALIELYDNKKEKLKHNLNFLNMPRLFGYMVGKRIKILVYMFFISFLLIYIDNDYSLSLYRMLHSSFLIMLVKGSIIGDFILWMWPLPPMSGGNGSKGGSPSPLPPMKNGNGGGPPPLQTNRLSRGGRSPNPNRQELGYI
jgi:hypothetical protein